MKKVLFIFLFGLFSFNNFALAEIPTYLDPNTPPADFSIESFDKTEEDLPSVPYKDKASEEAAENSEKATSEVPEEPEESEECDPNSGEYCLKLDTFRESNEVIKGKNGIDLMQQLIKKLYMTGAGIIGLLAVLIIVASGIQISFGGAHQESVNIAKTRIIQALLSLILLFSTALILKTINPAFFVTEKTSQTESEK